MRSALCQPQGARVVTICIAVNFFSTALETKAEHVAHLQHYETGLEPKNHRDAAH
jgi:hypothetical protein